MTRVLVVEDEPAILDALAYALRQEGFDVDTTTDGESALESARSEPYDLIVLDIMLPKLSGLDVCRTLRGESPVPIILLTAKGSELDRVVGLELGADDYVTKPFSMREVASRVRALLRRRELDRATADGALRVIGELRIDLARHEVTVGEQPVRLTRSELKILALLAEKPEHVYTRRELMEHLWESSYVGDERAADVHVSNLRRKLADAGDAGRIETVRGVGFRLVDV